MMHVYISQFAHEGSPMGQLDETIRHPLLLWVLERTTRSAYGGVAA